MVRSFLFWHALILFYKVFIEKNFCNALGLKKPVVPRFGLNSSYGGAYLSCLRYANSRPKDQL